MGSLYADDDPRKAYAYSAYYMGINLGGLIAPLICGTLGELYGWHWGFAAAGIGMAIGLAIYCTFLRFLPPEPGRAELAAEASAPVAPVIRQHVVTLLLMVSVVVLFRIGYEQSGNVIALWVSDFTDRSIALFGHRVTIPATWFQSINPLLITVFGISRFVPVYGDDVLPKKPLEALKEGAGSDIDVLIGRNAAEINLYFVPTKVREKAPGLLLKWLLRKSHPRSLEALKAYGGLRPERCAPRWIERGKGEDPRT